MFAGDFQQAKVWRHEKSLWIECSVRLRNRLDHLQFLEQVVSVRLHGHGQNSTQIHGVQRATRVTHQQEYHRRKLRLFKSLLHWFYGISIDRPSTRRKTKAGPPGVPTAWTPTMIWRPIWLPELRPSITRLTRNSRSWCSIAIMSTGHGTYPRAFPPCRSACRSMQIVMVEVIILVMIRAKCPSVLGICRPPVLDHIQEMGKFFQDFPFLDKISSLTFFRHLQNDGCAAPEWVPPRWITSSTSHPLPRTNQWFTLGFRQEQRSSCH